MWSCCKRLKTTPRQDFSVRTDIFSHSILNYLSLSERAKCAYVSRRWNLCVRENLNIVMNRICQDMVARAKEEWSVLFSGDVGEIPECPGNIIYILKNHCSYFPGKRVFQTHIFSLVPKSVNVVNLSLMSLNNAPFLFNNTWIKRHRNLRIESSRWVLMTKEFIPGSLGNSFEDQRGLIREKNPAYDAPPLLSALVCIINHYMSRGQRLYGGDLWRCTYCAEEIVERGTRKNTLLGFHPDRIVILQDWRTRDEYGIFAMRVL